MMKNIRKEIREELFGNLSEYVRVRALSMKTVYNWRTVKKVLEEISNTYKDFKSLEEEE